MYTGGHRKYNIVYIIHLILIIEIACSLLFYFKQILICFMGSDFWLFKLLFFFIYIYIFNASQKIYYLHFPLNRQKLNYFVGFSSIVFLYKKKMGKNIYARCYIYKKSSTIHFTKPPFFNVVDNPTRYFSFVCIYWQLKIFTVRKTFNDLVKNEHIVTK